MIALHPADEPNAHALAQARDAREESIAQINASHEAFMRAGATVREGIVAAVEAMEIIGIHLRALKAASHLDFSTLFTTTSEGVKNIAPRLCFSQAWGCRCMRVAERLSEGQEIPDGGTVKEVLQLMDVIAESERGEQSSHGAMNWQSTALRSVMSINAILAKQEEKIGEMQSWQRSHVETTEAMLRPLAKRHALALQILAQP